MDGNVPSAHEQYGAPQIRRRRLVLIIILFIVGVMASLACSPGIRVTNTSGQPAVVAVKPPRAGRVIKTLQPKQSATVDVWNDGRFTAAVVPTKDWTDFVRTKRDLLQSLAGAPDQTAAQVAQLKQQLADITDTIDRFGNAGGGGDACGADISGEPPADRDEVIFYLTFGFVHLQGGAVDVTMDSAGKPHVTCSVTSSN
jgi:hypothetical protein